MSDARREVEQPSAPHGRTPGWARLDAEHVWHPFTPLRGAPEPIPVERAEGVWLHTADGRRLLDGISSWWVNIHGHAHPRLVAALERQARRLEQVIFAGFTHEPAARLAARLVELAPPGLDRVFYSDDGSTAVEVALKLAAQHWRLRGDERRDTFVALEGAYHGDTFGAMAAGGVEVFQRTFRPYLCRVERAIAPHPYALGLAPDETVARARASLAAVLERNSGRVAAVIVEPLLQGAGGMIVWPRGYLRAVRDLCDEHGVPLIADEVLTGFGRTGRLLACEHEDIAPDILCLSKALTGGMMPLAATLVAEGIREPFETERRGATFFHGHSYTANALACAVALESLAIIDDERSLERVAGIERAFRARLDRLRGHELVADARGIGAVAALELRSPGVEGYLSEVGPRLARAFLERGILLRPLGDVVYFMPPYAIADDEIELVFEVIEAVLDAEAARPRA